MKEPTKNLKPAARWQQIGTALNHLKKILSMEAILDLGPETTLLKAIQASLDSKRRSLVIDLYVSGDKSLAFPAAVLNHTPKSKLAPTGNTFPCSCGRSFPSQEELTKHQTQFNWVKLKPIAAHQCPCGSSFPSSEELRKHQTQNSSARHLSEPPGWQESTPPLESGYTRYKFYKKHLPSGTTFVQYLDARCRIDFVNCLMKWNSMGPWIYWESGSNPGSSFEVEQHVKIHNPCLIPSPASTS